MRMLQRGKEIEVKMEKIEEVIKELDTDSSGSNQIKTYKDTTYAMMPVPQASTAVQNPTRHIHADSWDSNCDGDHPDLNSIPAQGHSQRGEGKYLHPPRTRHGVQSDWRAVQGHERKSYCA